MQIILLPGLHGTDDLFQEFIKCRPGSFSPIVVSLPEGEGLTYQTYTDAVSKEINFDQPTVILGESFSGPIALKLAAQNPQGLMGIVLVASFVTPPYPRALSFLPWDFLFSISSPLYTLRALLQFSPNMAKIVQQASVLLQKISSKTMAQRVRTALATDVVKELKECGVPILYLAGTKDFVVPSWNWKKIVALRPDVRVHHINAPHFVLQIAPREAWDGIKKFIDDIRLHIAAPPL